MSMWHSVRCKQYTKLQEGWLHYTSHDNLRYLSTNLLNRVCKGVEAEPHLLPVTNERFEHKTANTSKEARLDIKANSFWQRSKTAFFDIHSFLPQRRFICSISVISFSSNILDFQTKLCVEGNRT